MYGDTSPNGKCSLIQVSVGRAVPEILRPVSCVSSYIKSFVLFKETKQLIVE